MYFKTATLSLLLLATPVAAFVGNANTAFTRPSTSVQSNVENLSVSDVAEVNYKPGEAPTEFAKRYKHLAGAKIRTVGEAFSEFSAELGITVNPLYKNMITDIVGTTHLIIVSARFKKDAIWSLGMITTLELLLKNYPEPGSGDRIVSALFKSLGIDEAAVRAEGQAIMEWAKGKSKAEIEAALTGEGDSPVAAISKDIKADEFWMYSRFFGIGLLKLMEGVGVEMDRDEVYPVMESWMTDKVGRSHLTACADSDMFFKVKSKLDMMETLMKEIEIREKKRMAERLELKAEAALRAADREEKFAEEIDAEAKASRDPVESS